MAKFIIAKWLSDNGKWLSHVGRGACGVVGSIGAHRLDWGMCGSTHVCVGSVPHRRAWG
jgi:hypothetical protein